MRVIVTRPAAEAADWVQALGARGVDALALPLIEIRDAPDAAPVQAAWSRIGQYRAAMFVSANAVRAFFRRRPPDANFTPRAWATGPGTRAALQLAGVTAVDSPPDDAPQFDSESLWRVVGSQCKQGDHVLIVRGGEAGATGASGREWLADELAARGATVDPLLAYVRACPAFTAEQLEMAARAARDGSVWLFSSSQAVANLRTGLSHLDRSAARAIATHPRIAQAVREAGFGVVCVSRPSVDAVVRALESLG